MCTSIRLYRRFLKQQATTLQLYPTQINLTMLLLIIQPIISD